MMKKKFGKFSSKCRQSEICSLIRLEIMIKWKSEVQVRETNKSVNSGNWDIDILTLDCCNF